jgi:hypothetical protein
VLEAVKPTDDLREYLGLLFEGQTGYVYTAFRNQNLEVTAKDYWNPRFYEWPAQASEIYSFLTQTSLEYDTYIAPALFSAPESKKEFVKGSRVAWVDLDGKLPSSMQNIPAPSMVVESSNPENKKQHWYWVLDSFVTDIKQIERLNRGLAYLLDADVSGWDANQVLRPPATRNHKYGKAQPVTLLSLTPYALNSSAFGGIPEPPSIPVEFDVTDLQDASLIVASYQWTKQAFNLYRSLPEAITHKEGRSGALMQLAYFGAEFGMNDAEIFTILYHADSRWQKFVGRPDRVRRLNDIIAKARIKHPFKFESLQIKDLQVFGFQDFIQTEVRVEWVVQDFLEKSGQLLLSAKPGIGKSRFSLRFFIAMALGKPFLHYQPTDPQKLVYFSLEMGHAQLLYFLEKMNKSLSAEERELLQENLLLVPLGEALYLDKRAGQSLAEKVLEEHEPNGYGFDSLSRTTPDTVNDEQAIKLILDWDASTRNRRSMFSWYIHHNRKATTGNRKPKSLDDLLGATVIAANTTAAYTLWSNDPQNKTLDVICVKQRLAEMEKTYVISSDDDMGYSERAVLGSDIFEVEDALNIPGGTPTDGGLPSNTPINKPNLGF